MLTRVSPEFISAEDLVWLSEAEFSGPVSHRLDLANIVRGLWRGDYQLFRADNGVILTEISNKRLNLVKWAGRGLALRMAELTRDLQHIGRELGCNALETNVNSEKLARALKRIGAKQESVIMVLEFDDGQE